MADDYYKVLGVQRAASLEDIQDALRQENMRWSRRASNAPKAADRAEAEQRVELLGEIKTVLTNPLRKAQYDATLGGAQGTPRPQPQPNPWPEPQPNPWPQPQPEQQGPWPQPQPNRGQGQSDLEAMFRRGVWGLWSNRRNRGQGEGTGRRIRHPIWTTFLVIFAIASFGSAGGSNGSSSDPVGALIVGIIALLIAARVSGVWRRK